MKCLLCTRQSVMCQRYRSNKRDNISALVHWGESQKHTFVTYRDKFYKEKNKIL